MPNNKSLTKSDLISALKDVGVITKSNIAIALKEAGVITKSNIAIALKDVGVITKSNIAIALKEAGVITESNIAIALKKANVATKDDVRNIVGEEIVSRGVATKDDIHNQLTEFYHGMIKPEFNKVHGEINTLRKQTGSEFKKVDQRLNKLESGQSYIKNEISGLTAELSDTPSRAEINELKTRVDNYHPAN